MDYFDVLKKAWHITWRYKALWILGFFVGGAGSYGGGGGNTGYSTGGGSWTGSPQDAARIEQLIGDATAWIEANLALLAVVAGVAVLISLVLWVLSIAAQGGLVYGANEAAEDRSVRLGACWGVGFSRWGRTFMIGFLLAIPVFLILAVFIGILVATFIGIAASSADSSAAGLGAGGAFCCAMPLLGIVLFAVAVLLSIVQQLAVRYGILGDITCGKAIKRAWDDLWGKRGAFVFTLVMMLPGIAFSVAILVVTLPFVIASTMLALSGEPMIVAALAVAMMLLLIVPASAYGTFSSAAWTVFFRRMTGMEVVPVQQAPVPAYPGEPTTPNEPAPPVVSNDYLPPPPPTAGA